jgi:2-amino-4-hydroxy-6-hydroxymethyldihydropteridine diphosphokinase
MNPEGLLILGLGSNIGKREDFLARAVRIVHENTLLKLTNVRVSSWIETPALLPENAPEWWDIPFLNGVIAAQCAVADALTILQEVKHIEAVLGRQDRGRWGPREIDIDIIAYGNRVLHSSELTLPHAGMLERPFVLQPLAQVCPDWIYPDSAHADAYQKPITFFL